MAVRRRRACVQCEVVLVAHGPAMVPSMLGMVPADTTLGQLGVTVVNGQADHWQSAEDLPSRPALSPRAASESGSLAASCVESERDQGGT